MPTIYWDTEDDSVECIAERRSGHEKKCTQIAAIDDGGNKFYLEPKIISSRKDDGITRYKWNVNPFLEWLENHGKDTVAYAHNTAYDLGNLWRDELDLFTIRTMIGGRLIRAVYRNVSFLDSGNIWPMTLKKLGATVGLEKLERNDVGYIWRDVEIVKKGMELAERMARDYGVELPSTLGAFAIKIWQAMGGTNWACALNDAQKAYYGGRVELFRDQLAADILSVDINSLYPSQMTKAYPTIDNLWLGLASLDECDSIIRDLSRECFGIATATLTVPACVVAPLPARMEDGSVWFPTGTLQGTWTIHEIRMALSKGARLEKLHTAYGSLEGKYYYKDFINCFYRKRQIETDSGQKEMLKLLLNNCYGQLGMSGVITRSLNLKDHVIDIGNNECVLSKEGISYGNKLLAEIEMPLNGHVNWLHAAYVTSYSRIHLMHYLSLIPEKDLIYCDTDGIFFRGREAPFPIDDTLGGMKLVDKLTHVWCKGPKFYQIQTHKEKITKIKGIPRGLAAKSFEKDFVSFDQPYKLRESITYMDSNTQNFNEKSRSLSVWRMITKYNRTKYSKKILRRGRYYPKVLSTDLTSLT